MNQDIQIQGSSSGSDFYEEKKCDIFLRIFFRTIPSEEIRISGNIPELGAWNISNSFPMNTDTQMYPYWFNLKPLKVAKNTNIEFKIVIFENGHFREWEKLPNNGNRYHFIKFSKVCLEMREFIADIRERPVAKFDSDNEIQFPDNMKWRKIGVGKKICPFELAKETDSENSSDKISDLIGDMISPNCFDSLSFMSASKSLSESQSDFENEPDFNENNKSPLKATKKLTHNHANEIKLILEKKPENTFQEIYDKYIKNVFKSSKKKFSHNFIKTNPSFFLYPRKPMNIQNDLLIILSLFPPIKIKKIKESKDNNSPDPIRHIKWKIKPILDVFYTNFYNYLLKNNRNFYWFCWPGINLQAHEQKELTKFLQENYRIVPIFFDAMKMQSFIENLCFKRFKPACQNHFDFYSSELELEDIDFATYNEINKTFAKTSLKFISNNCKNIEKNFLVLNYHLIKVPFYLRKTILKSKKINKPFHHNIAMFFNNGFPNPENIRFLGNYRKLLISLLFSDLLIFSVFDHARNFCFNCEKYLQLSHKTHEGGRLYFEFEGRILFINIYHPYLEYPLNELHLNLEENNKENINSNNYDLLSAINNVNNHQNIKNIEDLCKIYKDFLIITSMDKIDSSSMMEIKFQAFLLFAQKQTTKKMVLIQLLYNVFEDSYVKNIEYIDKITQIANGINKSLGNNHIAVLYCNKIPRPSLNQLFKQTAIFLKLSLIRDEAYMHHLEYLCINDNAIIILSSNLFQTKAFKSIITINSLNMNSIQNALTKAESLTTCKAQECLVILDREYLRCNNVNHWFNYNFSSLQCFNYYNDKEFKLTLEKINYEGETFRLMPVTPNFEEFEVKNIANAYKTSENRVFVLDFEGLFLDICKINEMLNTNNILEIESKLNKCKPSLTVINDETMSKFKNIVQDPKNSVYVISSLSHDKLSYFFPDMKHLTLFSENGYFCQKIGRDEVPFVNFYEKADTSWKEIVKSVIFEYVSKTEGSYLIEKKYSLIWIFDKVDKEFATIQAKELLDHLTEVLEFIDVIEIVKYETLIEVRLKNCHKGMGCVMGVYETFMNKGPIDFFLCIGGAKEFSSDLFLASKTLMKSKDQIFDENVNFFNCTIDPKNCVSFADGYLKDMNEFHKLISLLGCVEEGSKDFSKKHMVRGGVFKKINFEEEEFQV